VGLDIDPVTASLRGRVEIVAFPERLVAALSQQQAAGEAIARSVQQRRAFFERMVEQRGLRAQLRSGSLLTGQLYVALDFFPDAPKAKVDWSQEKPALPVVPSTIPNLEAKITGILDKLDKLPYEAIGADVTKVLASLDGTLKDVNKTLDGVNADVTPELKKTLEDLRRMIATADDVLSKGVNGTLAQVNVALEELRRPLATADAVLKNADAALSNADATLLSQNAAIQQELRSALQEVTLAARSLRMLMDYLERHPESLIRGKTKQENP
jgi:paraquat-inducible protein B